MTGPGQRPQANILIAGGPGCGKTTLAEQVATALGDRVGGFATSEIRGGASQVGRGLHGWGRVSITDRDST